MHFPFPPSKASFLREFFDPLPAPSINEKLFKFYFSYLLSP